MTRIPFFIFGASGHAKVVVDTALRNGFTVDYIVDDAPPVAEMFGIRVIHSNELKVSPPFEFTVAIGDNSTRKRVFHDLLAKGGQARTLAHPSSVISPAARIEDGTVCCAGAIVNPAAAVGRNCILNTAASIDHDCRIGDHSHICPGVRLAGDVVVGSGSMIGIGTVVLQGVLIGSNCIVGGGSVVTRDIPDGTVAYGAPAKVRRTLP